MKSEKLATNDGIYEPSAMAHASLATRAAYAATLLNAQQAVAAKSPITPLDGTPPDATASQEVPVFRFYLSAGVRLEVDDDEDDWKIPDSVPMHVNIVLNRSQKAAPEKTPARVAPTGASQQDDPARAPSVAAYRLQRSAGATSTSQAPLMAARTPAAMATPAPSAALAAATASGVPAASAALATSAASATSAAPTASAAPATPAALATSAASATSAALATSAASATAAAPAAAATPAASPSPARSVAMAASPARQQKVVQSVMAFEPGASADLSTLGLQVNAPREARSHADTAARTSEEDRSSDDPVPLPASTMRLNARAPNPHGTSAHAQETGQSRQVRAIRNFGRRAAAATAKAQPPAETARSDSYEVTYRFSSWSDDAAVKLKLNASHTGSPVIATASDARVHKVLHADLSRHVTLVAAQPEPTQSEHGFARVTLVDGDEHGREQHGRQSPPSEEDAP